MENLYACINTVCWSICAVASAILVMTIAFGSIALMSYQSQLKTKDLQPVVISISPKIWDLVKDEEFVSAAIKSFKFPIIKYEKGKLVYRIWDTVIDKVSLKGSEFSFPDMSEGIRLQAENMQFHLSTKAELELWEEMFIRVQLARRKGEIGAKLENVRLDIELAWNDFRFTPNITMKCNANVEFSRSMEGMGEYKQQADRIITAKINEEVPQMLTNMINEKINPYLQKLKKLMRKYGIYNLYNVSLGTELDSIRVIMKRKNGKGKMPIVQNLNKMIYVYGNLASATVPASNVIADFATKHLEEIMGDEESENLRLNPVEVIQNSTEQTFTFQCLDTKFECERFLCEYSTNINVNLSSLGAKSDIKSCIPLWPTSYSVRLGIIFSIFSCVIRVLFKE